MTPTAQARAIVDYWYSKEDCPAEHLVDAIAAALQATEQRIWEDAAQIAEEFGALSWEEMEAKYFDLGVTVAKLLHQRAHPARQGEETT